MSKILLINGSPHPKGCTYTALREVADALDAHGVQTELVHIGIKPVAGCIACGHCRQTGHCVFREELFDRLSEQLDTFQGIVVGSPVYFAGPSGQLCAFLDRFFYSNSGRFSGKLAASVVSCRRGGASAAFDRLNKYFTIANMPLVPSQYWNQVHGNTPDEVRKDLEGLQTMRTLAQNMAWLLNCIEAGNAAGVTLPEYEPKLRTNFID